MREILFKAKLKDWKTNPQQNKWVEGYYLSRKETTYCFTEDYEKNPVKTLHYIALDSMTDWGLPNEFRLFEIDPDTLCQCTGLIDKNENKIWENDIIKEYCNGLVGRLIWDVSTSTYKLEGFGDDYKIEDANIEWEVIGNIFDNPELLERN